MKLTFDDQALADLENIYRWIAQDCPASAKMVIDRLFSSAAQNVLFLFSQKCLEPFHRRTASTKGRRPPLLTREPIHERSHRLSRPAKVRSAL